MQIFSDEALDRSQHQRLTSGQGNRGPVLEFRGIPLAPCVTFSRLDWSSRPRFQTRKTSSKLEAQILVLRRQRRHCAQIRMLLPVSKATRSRALRNHHLSRPSSPEPPKPPVIGYERDNNGELLHLDIKKLAA